MKNYVYGIALGLTILLVAAVFNLIVINSILGCESWDRDLWTPEHSCITVGEYLDWIVFWHHP